MIVRGTRTTYALLTLILVAVLLYVELYPFQFRVPVGGDGPLNKLIESWAERSPRADFLANVLAYIPLGLFSTLALATPRRVLRWCPVAVIAGFAFSVALEITQYFVEGRVTSAMDVCANTVGVLFGSVGALLLARSRNFLLPLDLFVRPVPLILLTDWLAYRLYPYVPSSDVHKFWVALKPILLYPELHLYDLWRYTILWFTIFALLGATLGSNRSFIGAFLFSGLVIGAKIIIVDKILTVPEITGAGLALCLWPIALWMGKRFRCYVLA